MNIIPSWATLALSRLTLPLIMLTAGSMVHAANCTAPVVNGGLYSVANQGSGKVLDITAGSLQGIAFANPGSVTPAFGTIKQVTSTSSAAAISFATPEFAEFQFGNPLSLNGKSDWVFDTTGLRAGDAFSITATVPEPSSFALLLSALALMGVYAVRRNGQG